MNSKRIKNVIIVATLSLLILLIVGVVQSIIIKVKRNSLAELTQINTSLKEEQTKLQSDYNSSHDYIFDENGDISDKYKNDYKDHNVIIDENSVGENVDNETIIVIIK